MALAFAACQAALDRLGHGYALRQGERDRGVDADAKRGGGFDGRDAGPGRRNLDDHVGRQPVEAPRLREDGVGVAVEFWVRLNRQAAVSPLVRRERGQQQRRCVHGQALDGGPTNLLFGCHRQLPNQGLDSGTPLRHPGFEHGKGDHRIAGGADAAVCEGKPQLVEIRGIVPQTRRRGLSHLMKRTLPGRAAGHGGDHSPSFRRYARLRLALSFGVPYPGKTSCSTTAQPSYCHRRSAATVAGKSTAPAPSSQNSCLRTAAR